MGHGITLTDRMAYVGELPWHGLGTRLVEHPPSAAAALSLAGLDYRVGLRPALFRRSDGSIGEVPDRRAVVREDRELGLATVGARYHTVQNAELAEILDGLTESGARVHTLGSLHGGRRVWILAQLPLGFVVKRRSGREDAHASFLGIWTSHDGTGAVTLKPTDVRVVCANTLGMASRDGLAEASVRHTASASDRLAALARVLGEMPEAARVHGETLAELEDAPMARADVVAFAGAVLADLRAESGLEARESLQAWLDKASDASVKRMERATADVLRAFSSGMGNEGATRLDALNGLSEWIDHKRARGRDAARAIERSFESSLDGTGAARKARAVKLLSRW